MMKKDPRAVTLNISAVAKAKESSCLVADMLSRGERTGKRGGKRGSASHSKLYTILLVNMRIKMKGGGGREGGRKASSPFTIEGRNYISSESLPNGS